MIAPNGRQGQMHCVPKKKKKKDQVRMTTPRFKSTT
ncbi:hypothetical protein E2C01_042516 [Portunus trituberculatus]|uniref:Uncharacterized protein n=1 Tax=Portunus trituberculatus TaxID=210409 RepID=A0A5B7FWQ2_PORTR|nr:hypothetical protein [Portunus trituberculatus]